MKDVKISNITQIFYVRGQHLRKNCGTKRCAKNLIFVCIKLSVRSENCAIDQIKNSVTTLIDRMIKLLRVMEGRRNKFIEDLRY